MGLTLRIPNEIPLTNQQLDDNFRYLHGLINDLTAEQEQLSTQGDARAEIVEISLDGKQPLNVRLTSISNLDANGIMVLSDSAVLVRNIVSDNNNHIVITNGDGQQNNIGLNIGQNVLTNTSTHTVTNKSLSGTTNTFTNISLESSVVDILPIANGGTGSNNILGARANLNVLIKPNTNGIVIKTNTDESVCRQIQVTGIGLSISDSTGVEGNPTIASNATSNNTSNTLVSRDSNGNFSASKITASELTVNKGSSVFPHIMLDGKGFVTANTDLTLVYSLDSGNTSGQFVVGKKSSTEGNVTKVFSISNQGQIKSEIANYETLVTENNVLTNKKYVDDTFVDAAGDTMTGFLTLHSNPTENMHAATKKYVDDTFVDTTGDTMTGFLTLHSNPVQNMHAATKKYVDDVFAKGPSVFWAGDISSVDSTLLSYANVNPNSILVLRFTYTYTYGWGNGSATATATQTRLYIKTGASGVNSWVLVSAR